MAGRSAPETRNPKPETQNPKPETRNPKPETRNRSALNLTPCQERPEANVLARCGVGGGCKVAGRLDKAFGSGGSGFYLSHLNLRVATT